MSHSEPDIPEHVNGANGTTGTTETPAAGAAVSLEVSNAVARLHKEYIGRGPTNVRTTIDGDLVVVLLQGGYTRAEQTLGANDMVELVAAGRLALQDAMRQALVTAVQSLLGREVVSFMSANDLERSLQVEVFVLGPESEVSRPA